MRELTTVVNGTSTQGTEVVLMWQDKEGNGHRLSFEKSSINGEGCYSLTHLKQENKSIYSKKLDIPSHDYSDWQPDLSNKHYRAEGKKTPPPTTYARVKYYSKEGISKAVNKAADDSAAKAFLSKKSYDKSSVQTVVSNIIDSVYD